MARWPEPEPLEEWPVGTIPHTVMEIAGEKDWPKERLLLLILVYLDRTMVDGDAIHNLLDHLEDQE